MARESILIIDKDAELARILGLFLNLQGYRINYTARATDARTKLSLQKYAAVIIDPDLGEAAVDVMSATLDAGGPNAATPFIIATRSMDFAIPNVCLSKIKAMVRKPFEFEDLLAAIQMACADTEIAAAS